MKTEGEFGFFCLSVRPWYGLEGLMLCCVVLGVVEFVLWEGESFALACLLARYVKVDTVLVWC